MKHESPMQAVKRLDRRLRRIKRRIRRNAAKMKYQRLAAAQRVIDHLK